MARNLSSLSQLSFLPLPLASRSLSPSLSLSRYRWMRWGRRQRRSKTGPKYSTSGEIVSWKYQWMGGHADGVSWKED